MDRRTVLRTGTLGAVALIAGCQSEISDVVEISTDTESPTDTVFTTDTSTPRQTGAARETTTDTPTTTETETATPTREPAETEAVTVEAEPTESGGTLTATEVGTADRVELTPYTLSADDLGPDWERTTERVYGSSIDREFTNTETGTRIGTAVLRAPSEDGAQSQLTQSLDRWGGGEELSTTVGQVTYESHPSDFQTGLLFRDGRFLGFVGVELDSGEASVDTAVEYARQLHEMWA